MYLINRIILKFSHLINESNKYDEMGVGSISNKDNANPKQLKWEMQRDERLNGKNWKNKKGTKFSKHSKNFKSKSNNKNGKVNKKSFSNKTGKKKFSKKTK